MRKFVRRACVLACVLAVTLSQLVACSSEGSDRTNSHAPDETSGSRTTPDASGTLVESGPEGAYLVPVSHPASRRQSLDPQDPGEVKLLVPRAFRGELEAAVGGSLRSLDSSEAVLRRVGRTRNAVGLVPWRDVDARVKVLAVDGSDPLRWDAKTSGEYPLDFGDAPDASKLRRVVVGGDIVLDRGLPYAVYQVGRGLGFPLSGGYTEVTSRRAVPSKFSEYGEIHEFTAGRRGGAGAVKSYLRGADLTLANFENPVLANATYHPEGTVFEGDLTLLPLLNEAGIDGVTLANNHVLDAGETGLYETISHLDNAGISHAGAGEDLASAREPMVFDLGGMRVGVLSYLDVPGYEWSWARPESFGTAPLKERILEEDVERLKKRADVVVVMPHWGEEYTATPEPGEVELAHAAVEAGADAVVGGHAHWAKGMEVYEESPVYYGVGNFMFDQVWSEETSTGLLAELTLYDGRVIQSRPVPFMNLDYGQPNFLLPADRERVLRGVYRASIGPQFEDHR